MRACVLFERRCRAPIMGFTAGPPTDGAVALMDLRGVLDNIVPANVSNGWPSPGSCPLYPGTCGEPGPHGFAVSGGPRNLVHPRPTHLVHPGQLVLWSQTGSFTRRSTTSQPPGPQPRKSAVAPPGSRTTRQRLTGWRRCTVSPRTPPAAAGLMLSAASTPVGTTGHTPSPCWRGSGTMPTWSSVRTACYSDLHAHATVHCLVMPRATMPGLKRCSGVVQISPSRTRSRSESDREQRGLGN